MSVVRTVLVCASAGWLAAIVDPLTSPAAPPSGLAASASASTPASTALVETGVDGTDGPWPAFTVTDLAGAEVSSASLSREGHWLAVYVTSATDPALEWLQQFDKPPLANLAPSLVVIVGQTDREGAVALRERYPTLHAARWYLDGQGAAFEALRVSAVPMTWGMDGAEERWRVVGILPDRAVMTSLLQTWVSQ